MNQKITSYVPEKMYDLIEDEIVKISGHPDFALFVLDGQTADKGDDGYHDALATWTDEQGREFAMKFTLDPEGVFTSGKPMFS